MTISVSVSIPVGVRLDLAGDKLLDEFFVQAGIIIGKHGSEFQKSEWGAMLPDPLLPEEYRTFGSQLHQRRNYKKDRRAQYEAHAATHDIYQPFDCKPIFSAVVLVRKIRIQHGI